MNQVVFSLDYSVCAFTLSMGFKVLFSEVCSNVRVTSALFVISRKLNGNVRFSRLLTILIQHNYHDCVFHIKPKS